jgi:O-antigen/teichoic acid export membrane protein
VAVTTSPEAAAPRPSLGGSGGVVPAERHGVATAGKRLTDQTIVGMGWTSLAMGGQAVLQLAAVILLARLLQPSDFGIFTASMVIAGFCTIFSELGVGPAIVQRPNLEPRHIRVGFTLSVLLSFATGALVWTAAPAIAGFFQMPELTAVVRVMALAFPMQGVSVVAMSLAQRELRFRWLASVDASAFALGFVVTAPLLTLIGLGIWALVGAYMTQQAVRMIVLTLGQRHQRWPLLELDALRDLLYFGAGFTLARIGNYVAGQGDNLVVGRMLGAQSLGLYGHAYQLMAAPAMLFGQILDRVLFPAMARVQLEPVRLARAYRTGISFCALVMLPSGILIAILATEIVGVLLGPAWAGVAEPLRILAFGMLFRTSYKLSDTIARATGAVYARAWRQAVFAAAIIVSCAIGQVWGLVGVAFGVVTALALNFALMAHLSLRLTGMTWRGFGRAHLPGLVLGAFVAVCATVAAAWLRQHEVAPILVLLGTSSIAGILTLPLLWLGMPFFLGPEGPQVTQALSRIMAPRLARSVAE